MKTIEKILMFIALFLIFSIVSILTVLGINALAEDWTLEAGATTYNDKGESIGWYDADTEINIIGVKDGFWQTSDDLFIKPEEARKHLIGTFLCTYYTPSPSENGGSNLTACGDRLSSVVDYAIAVDPKVIRYNTKVYIDDVGWRVARDCGGAIKGNHIDILTWNVPSYGRIYKKVWVMK